MNIVYDRGFYEEARGVTGRHSVKRGLQAACPLTIKLSRGRQCAKSSMAAP